MAEADGNNGRTATGPVPRLSVAVLNYNYGKYLPFCIESILKQSFTDFEVIILDDCSTEDFAAVTAKLPRDPRVRVVRHAINRGFVDSLIEVTEEFSRGEFVTVISADDFVLDPDAFKKQIALLDGDPNMALCFGAHDRVDSVTLRSYDVHRPFPEDRVMEGVEFGRMMLASIEVQVLHSGAMLRASAYRASGGYRRDMRYCVDTAMWLTIPLFGSVGYSASVLYAYRSHESQMSTGFASVLPTMRETRAALESVFRIAQRRRVDLGITLTDALRVYLPAMAVADAFADRKKACVMRLVANLQVDGFVALSSRRFWIAGLRLALGDTGYRALQGALGRGTLPPKSAA